MKSLVSRSRPSPGPYLFTGGPPLPGPAPDSTPSYWSATKLLTEHEQRALAASYAPLPGGGDHYGGWVDRISIQNTLNIFSMFRGVDHYIGYPEEYPAQYPPSYLDTDQDDSLTYSVTEPGCGAGAGAGAGAGLTNPSFRHSVGGLGYSYPLPTPSVSPGSGDNEDNGEILQLRKPLR